MRQMDLKKKFSVDVRILFLSSVKCTTKFNLVTLVAFFLLEMKEM